MHWHRLANTTQPNSTMDVASGLLNEIRQLMSDGVDPNDRGQGGNTILHLIASGNCCPSAAVYDRPIDGFDEISDEDYRDLFGEPQPARVTKMAFQMGPNAILLKTRYLVREAQCHLNIKKQRRFKCIRVV